MGILTRGAAEGSRGPRPLAFTYLPLICYNSTRTLQGAETMLPIIKKCMLKTARSGFGGALASFCVRRCLWLLPVEIATQSKEYVMFRHPQPAARRHDLIVPRNRFPHVGALLEDEAAWAAFAAFAEENVPFQEVSLCCNYGCRQEVKQAHFHVLPKEQLALEEGGEADWLELGGWKAGLTRRGNACMDAGGLAAMGYARAVFAEAARRYPAGFSLLWQ